MPINFLELGETQQWWGIWKCFFFFFNIGHRSNLLMFFYSKLRGTYSQFLGSFLHFLRRLELKKICLWYCHFMSLPWWWWSSERFKGSDHWLQRLKYLKCLSCLVLWLRSLTHFNLGREIGEFSSKYMMVKRHATFTSSKRLISRMSSSSCTEVRLCRLVGFQ